MSHQKTNLEIIAPSVEEAIEKGLSELGVTEDEVDIEVLDPGSRGLFGLGSRQARVKLVLNLKEKENKTPIAVHSADEAVSFEEMSVIEQKEPAVQRVESDVDLAGTEEAQRVALSVVEELLERLKVQASVSTEIIPAEDERSKPLVWVDVRGNDLSILIGPRAETLNALQYITGLIVSKELGRSIPLVIDVEGFRARRTQQLRQLARRMADQAIKTGRRQVLEPMPASERRIIHIELRDNPQVTTESIGEDPRRKVTIIPK